MKRLLMAICIALFGSGCDTAPTYSAPQNPQNASGILLSDAHEKSKKLMPEMTQEQVRALLGEPDETSAQTFGSSTTQPWNGVVWKYRWDRPGDYSLFLIIVFEKWNDAWVVNMWRWSP
jgi:hypothetical protein